MYLVEGNFVIIQNQGRENYYLYIVCKFNVFPELFAIRSSLVNIKIYKK